MFKFGTGYGGTLKVLQSNFVILRYQKFDQIRTIMLISKHMFLKCQLIFVNIGKPHMAFNCTYSVEGQINHITNTVKTV